MNDEGKPSGWTGEGSGGCQGGASQPSIFLLSLVWRALPKVNDLGVPSRLPYQTILVTISYECDALQASLVEGICNSSFSDCLMINSIFLKSFCLSSSSDTSPGTF